MSFSQPIQCIAPNKVNAGMPLLTIDSTNSISPYEFLPSWFFYTPVVLQSLVQGIKYRNWKLPLIANPSIKLSGMVGESKHDILSLAGEESLKWISPFTTITTSKAQRATQLKAALQSMQRANIDFPVVAKPDLGCRGAGVKLLHSSQQLDQYIASFPVGARFLIQEKAPYQAEAGVFYVRYPGQSKGKVISMTLKYAPTVIGDGKSTLKQLIELCPRAGQLSHLYFPRHTSKLNWVPCKEEEFQLAFAGSHSRGSIFRNGNQFITDKLAQRLDAIFDDFDGFHYGRLDIKFKDMPSLMNGDAFTILEINGASSEAAHIWDRQTPLKEIFTTLLYQYRLLFDIGAQQQQRGFQTPPLKELLLAWKEEKRLTEQYPSTD
ncbi:D-alanine--D-alanine ligase [Vibrio profundi]|uniref:D-alanine--D-alanine ligase n=1 Tax=Vibrio profundi TaxID=1774960 RepID=UPI0037365EFF